MVVIHVSVRTGQKQCARVNGVHDTSRRNAWMKMNLKTNITVTRAKCGPPRKRSGVVKIRTLVVSLVSNAHAIVLRGMTDVIRAPVKMVSWVRVPSAFAFGKQNPNVLTTNVRATVLRGMTDVIRAPVRTEKSRRVQNARA